MKRTLWLFGSLILLLGAYLSLWPVAIEPVVWQPLAAPEYSGVHASNMKLASLPKIALDGEVGPEHIVAGGDGKLYAGMASGNIVRFNADGSAQQIFSETGGRPLGMAFAADGQLIVADAIMGLLSVAPDGSVSVLATTVHGAPIRFPNAVVVARNGKIYFTDSSMRFAPADWGGTLEAATLDIFEQSSTGRVLEYSAENKAVRVVARGLSLANGIALSTDETALFVSESGKYGCGGSRQEATSLMYRARLPRHRYCSITCQATRIISRAGPMERSGSVLVVRATIWTPWRRCHACAS